VQVTNKGVKEEKRVAIIRYDCHKSYLPQNMQFTQTVNLLQHATAESKVNNTIHLLPVVSKANIFSMLGRYDKIEFKKNSKSYKA